VQITSYESMTDEDINYYIKTAYNIICQKLTKAKRQELNLTSP